MLSAWSSHASSTRYLPQSHLRASRCVAYVLGLSMPILGVSQVDYSHLALAVVVGALLQILALEEEEVAAAAVRSWLCLFFPGDTDYAVGLVLY